MMSFATSSAEIRTVFQADIRIKRRFANVQIKLKVGDKTVEVNNQWYPSQVA